MADNAFIKFIMPHCFFDAPMEDGMIVVNKKSISSILLACILAPSAIAAGKPVMLPTY